MAYRVAIVGSRDFPGEIVVREYVRMLPKDTVIVSGGARGVDSWAAEEAEKRGMPKPTIYPVSADGLPPYPLGRSEFRRRAFERNKKIALDCDWLVAFRSLGKSTGTDNTIGQCEANHVPYAVITPAKNMPGRWKIRSTEDLHNLFLERRKGN